MARRLIARLKRAWLANRKLPFTGFTLIELLVSVLIGSIIIVSLLGLVVELTDADRKDVGRSETQRDVQLAMNYIVQDVREAVYVYDGLCIGTAAQGNKDTDWGGFCPGLLNHLSTNMNRATLKPMLAFWRTDPIPQDLITKCGTVASDLTALNDLTTKGVPCVSGRNYTLVMYGLDTDNPGGLWRGRARLVRYSLSQFPADVDANNPVQTTGYVDPRQAPTKSSFQQWPYLQDTTGTNSIQAALPSNSPDVLLDFVDDGKPVNRTPVAQAPICDDRAVGERLYWPTYPTGTMPTTPGGQVFGFYGCVRGNTIESRRADPAKTDTQKAEAIAANQEVQLTLVGNVEGRAGFRLSTDTEAVVTQGRTFPLQTTVLTRGVLEKNPT